MKSLIVILSVFGMMGAAHGDESAGDAAAKAGHDAKRSMKRGMHKTEEAVCAEGDAKCAGKKAKHRGEEAVDYSKDKTKEAVDKAGK